MKLYRLAAVAAFLIGVFVFGVFDRNPGPAVYPVVLPAEASISPDLVRPLVSNPANEKHPTAGRAGKSIPIVLQRACLPVPNFLKSSGGDPRGIGRRALDGRDFEPWGEGGFVALKINNGLPFNNESWGVSAISNRDDSGCIPVGLLGRLKGVSSFVRKGYGLDENHGAVSGVKFVPSKPNGVTSKPCLYATAYRQNNSESRYDHRGNGGPVFRAHKDWPRIVALICVAFVALYGGVMLWIARL